MVHSFSQWHFIGANNTRSISCLVIDLPGMLKSSTLGRIWPAESSHFYCYTKTSPTKNILWNLYGRRTWYNCFYKIRIFPGTSIIQNYTEYFDRICQLHWYLLHMLLLGWAMLLVLPGLMLLLHARDSSIYGLWNSI